MFYEMKYTFICIKEEMNVMSKNVKLVSPVFVKCNPLWSDILYKNHNFNEIVK